MLRFCGWAALRVVAIMLMASFTGAMLMRIAQASPQTIRNSTPAFPRKAFGPFARHTSQMPMFHDFMLNTLRHWSEAIWVRRGR